MKLFIFDGNYNTQQITQHCMSGNIVLLKNFISANDCHSFRDELISWKNSSSSENTNEHYSKEKLNYHLSVSNKTIRPHKKNWVDYEEDVTLLDVYNYRIGNMHEPFIIQQVPIFQNIGSRLLSLYSEVSPNKNLRHGQKDEKNLFFEIAHYSCDGGYIDKHTHIRNMEMGQDINMLTMLAQKDSDFSESSLIFSDGKETLDTGSLFNIGDVIFFRMDILHWVTPTQASKNNSESRGRWTMSTFYY